MITKHFIEKFSKLLITPRLTIIEIIEISLTGARSSVLRHVIVNDTLHGITINDNLSEIMNVVSNFSQEHGFIFNVLKNDTSSSKDDSETTKGVSSSGVSNTSIGFELSTGMKVENLTAANNTKSGVVVLMDGKVAEMVDLEISSCLLYGNNDHGIDVLANATVTLSSCDIVDNRLSGVHIDQDFGGRTYVVSSTLSLNREYAINSVETNEILVDSCEVRSHVYGYYGYRTNWYTRRYISISRDSSTELTVILRDNRFFNNVADGIHVDLKYTSRGKYSLTVENNLFENCNRSLVIADSSYSVTNNEGHISISNNTFNGLSNSVSEIMRFDLRSSSELVIDHNLITGVAALNIVVIEGEKDIRENNITINDNIISDNDVQETILLTSYQDNISLSGNIFSNPGSECELKVPDFLSSSYSVNAKLNYWGAELSSEVVGKVCGFEEDMSESFVYYVPYYLDDSLQDTVNQEQDSLSVEGSLGGEVTEDLTLTQSNSPYRISRSLIIRYVFVYIHLFLLVCIN